MPDEQNGSEDAAAGRPTFEEPRAAEENGPEDVAADRRAFEKAGDAEENASPEAVEDAGPPPSPFPHPPWTVGVVLILGAVSLLFGLLVRPIFLAVGSPFIIALFLWLYVKLFAGSSSS